MDCLHPLRVGLFFYSYSLTAQMAVNWFIVQVNRNHLNYIADSVLKWSQLLRDLAVHFHFQWIHRLNPSRYIFRLLQQVYLLLLTLNFRCILCFDTLLD